MGLLDLFVTAVALSMDAFAVSVSKGLSVKRVRLKHGLITGAYFGGFQALMPLAGFLLGSLLAEAITAVDHWIAFLLLAVIGVNMLREAFSREEEEEGSVADLSVRTMFTMAVATSIDALAVGISLAMAGGVNILGAVILIGVTTFALSAVGVKVGSVFGSRFEKKAEAMGGVILIALGVKILLEHLGVL